MISLWHANTVVLPIANTITATTMAVMDIESRFDRWAVSSAGALGLMQVMPFWPEQLGMRRHQLTAIEPNIRMGCAILRFYLERERHDFRRALARYNGSVGTRGYADLVVVRWTSAWPRRAASTS